MSKAAAQRRKPMRRVTGDFMTIDRARRRYKHGTRAMYALGRCRCTKCRRANRELVAAQTVARSPYRTRKGDDGTWRVYHAGTDRVVRRAESRSAARSLCDELNAAHRERHPDPTQLIATDNVVRHIRALQANGIGLKHIARVAGIAYSPLSRIMEGDIVRTRNSTAAKILGVTVEHISDGAHVRADEAFVLLERLVAIGFTRAALAARLGSSRTLQIGRSTPNITVRTARAVHALYREVQMIDKRLPPIARQHTIGVTESTAVRVGKRCKPQLFKELATPALRVRTFVHGTRARYTEAGCRCKACIKANADYEACLASKQVLRFAMREAKNGYVVIDGHTRAVVSRHASRSRALALRDALIQQDPVRSGRAPTNPDATTAHIRALIAAGVSVADIAKASGCSHSYVARLCDRTKSVRSISRAVQASILAVDVSAASGNIAIDASDIWQLVDRLCAAGFRKDWLAKTAGITLGSPRGRRIKVERARAIIALYALLRERVPLLRQLETRKRGIS